jgi:hypothetical protein
MYFDAHYLSLNAVVGAVKLAVYPPLPPAEIKVVTAEDN